MEVALSIVCRDNMLCYYYYYNLHTKWTIPQRKREKERKKERKKSFCAITGTTWNRIRESWENLQHARESARISGTLENPDRIYREPWFLYLVSILFFFFLFFFPFCQTHTCSSWMWLLLLLAVSVECELSLLRFCQNNTCWVYVNGAVRCISKVILLNLCSLLPFCKNNTCWVYINGSVSNRLSSSSI